MSTDENSINNNAYILPDTVTHYNSTDMPDYYNENYIINGIRFEPPLEIDESKSELSIKVWMNAKYTHIDENTKRTFPAGTFQVVISLNKYGTAEYFDGRVYDINDIITIGEFNTINIDISNDIDAFSSGIRSIGIRIKDTDNFVEGDSIGIGWVSTSSYNRRPYVPYMYTQDWGRLKWSNCNNNKGQSASAIVTARKDENSSYYHFLYPIDLSNNEENDETRNIPKTDIKNINLLGYLNNRGTAFNINDTIDVKSFTRNKNEIEVIDDNNNSYKTTNSGNQILFEIPAETGKLFKIDTNIPFNIYDLINIEYYIQSYSDKNRDCGTVQESSTGGVSHACITHDSNCVDEYIGSFSKGDIIIHFYDKTDITNIEPVESFALPSWGYQAIKANVSNKIVHSWFKKRSEAKRIRSIVLERKNPTNTELYPIQLVLNNILLYNADTMPALGPQMQMRIYPDTSEASLDDIEIRKIGCIYRL